MLQADGQPWFHAAVQLLDLRRQDRVLAMLGFAHQVRDLAALVGTRGQVTVVQPDRIAAEAVAALELPQVEVLCHAVAGDERFGTFDALMLAPRTDPQWPKGAHADLARANLRPGGRLVIDLPGPDMLPDLAAAAVELGFDRTRLAPLHGLGDDELADILRNAGLRRVQALLGSHLLHLDSPFDLVDTFGPALGTSEQERIELGHALVRRLGSTSAVDVLLHRTRVQALR